MSLCLPCLVDQPQWHAPPAAQSADDARHVRPCREDQRLIARLNWIKERGRKLGVIGTPNFFINGRLIKSVIGMKEIREIVDPILATRSAARAGG